VAILLGACGALASACALLVDDHTYALFAGSRDAGSQDTGTDARHASDGAADGSSAHDAGPVCSVQATVVGGGPGSLFAATRGASGEWSVTPATLTSDAGLAWVTQVPVVVSEADAGYHAVFAAGTVGQNQPWATLFDLRVLPDASALAAVGTALPLASAHDSLLIDVLSMTRFEGQTFLAFDTPFDIPDQDGGVAAYVGDVSFLYGDAGWAPRPLFLQPGSHKRAGRGTRERGPHGGGRPRPARRGQPARDRAALGAGLGVAGPRGADRRQRTAAHRRSHRRDGGRARGVPGA